MCNGRCATAPESGASATWNEAARSRSPPTAFANHSCGGPAAAPSTTFSPATSGSSKATRSSATRTAPAGRLLAGDGDGEDQFRFMLSREEFLELFLEDLELPDLAKRRLADLESEGMRRAGYTASGSPANLAILRTMRVALSRRIAMRRPGSGDLNRLAEEIRSSKRRGIARSRRPIAGGAGARAAAPPHDPVHRSARSALPPPRAGFQTHARR